MNEQKGIYIYGITVSNSGKTILDESPMMGPYKYSRLVGQVLVVGDDEGDKNLFMYDPFINRWKLLDGSEWSFTDIITVNEQGVEL